MSEPRNWHLVLYDVSEPKRLRKVHKHLKAWGEPVQYSAFWVRGTARELERLRFELSLIMDADDRLMVARLCPGCVGRVLTRGAPLADLGADVPTCHIV